VPLGAANQASQVYDRVVVGSDGSYSSLVGVRQAMAIARRNGAKLTIVTVYNPEGESKGPRRELEGLQAGRHALQRTVDDLNSNRVTTYDSVLHPGDVASGLLVAAANTPKTLIVVGNRGVGARDVGNLGVVADQVLKDAKCDVIVVRTDETAGSSSR
jgi:maltose/moltooligosaccharide transporter